MAKQSGPSKSAKLSRQEKRLLRGAKRQQRKQSWKNLRQAFTLTRKSDPRFIPYMILFGTVAGAAVYLLALLISGGVFTSIPFGIFAIIITCMLVFSRRAQSSMFNQAEGQPGAAGWMLSQQIKGDWRLTQAVAGTAHMDAVHRLVGRPGVVLIGEGAQHRVRGLIAQEKKKIARVAGETPIYDRIVGTEEGDLRLSKLSKYLLKLPSNLSKDEVAALDKKLAALSGGGRMPLPQGPMPQGAKMRNVQRSVRRHS